IENGVLAIAAGRRIGVADVAAGAIAGPSSAVVMAACVLRDVAAKRTLVPDLRGGGKLCTLREQREFLLDGRVGDHFRQGGHGAYFDAAVRHGADTAQLIDAAQIDDHSWLLNAVLEPIEAVESAGEHPGIAAMLLEKFLRFVSRSGLEQIERGHDVSNYGHGFILLSSFALYMRHQRVLHGLARVE